MSLVTMFTDASWNRKTHQAVWASWAKLNGETIRNSGQLKSTVPQIGTAELVAIANGLYCISKQFQHAKGDKILIQTDSLEAIHAINGQEHPRAQDRAIVVHIKAFAETHGWLLELRHVKGHRGTSSPRHAVNTWCDKECRRLMGLALAPRSAEVIPFPDPQPDLFAKEQSA
jgi:ribonuclease HI